MFIDYIRSLRHGDKLGHFWLFGILTLVVTMASKFRSFSFGPFTLYYGVAIVSIFVVLEEVSQKFITIRTFSVWDLAADAAGIAVFTLIAWALDAKRLKCDAYELKDH